MNVTLVRYTDDPQEAIELAAANCYNSKPNGKIMKACYESGHKSVLEFAQFHFHIEGISRACYDNQTKVLTNHGWKLFEDVDINNDLICSLNNDNEIEYVKAVNYIQYPYNGCLDYYKSSQIELAVTPNHKMWVYDYEKTIPQKTRTWKFIRSDQMINGRYCFEKSSQGIQRTGIQEIDIPTVVRKHHLPFVGTKITSEKINYFLEFLGIWVTDGFIAYGQTKNGARITGNRVGISQKKQHVRNRISYLLNQLNFKNYSTDNMFYISNQALFDWLETNFIKGKDAHKTYYLQLPRWMFTDLNKENIEKFLLGVFLGNGSYLTGGLKTEITDDFKITSSYRIYTCSYKFAEDIVELALLSGKCANIYTVPPRKRVFPKGYSCNIKTQYAVSVLMSGYHLFHMKKHKSTIAYNNDVYCLELEKYHKLYVMRNGRACWCGNCSHQLVRARTGSYAQRSQRYCSEDGFEIVTPPSILTKHTAKASYDRLMHQIESAYEELQRLGIPNEDARFVLPNACCTNIDVSFDLRNLAHFMNERLCRKAQWEIRELAQKMRQCVIEVFPEAASMLVPKCEMYNVHFCTEKKPCGRHARLEDMLHQEESDGE